MEIPRTARIPFDVDVDALLPDGEDAPLTEVRWAICDRSGPTADTVWLTATYDAVNDVGTAVVCGPDADDKSSALVLTVPRAQLWALPVQDGAAVPGFIDTLELL